MYEELGTSWWVNLPAHTETSSLTYLTQGVSTSIDDQRNTSVILLRNQLRFSPKEAVTSAYNVVNKILDFQRLAPLLHIMKAQIIIIINNAQIKLASYGLFSVSKDM